MSAKIHKLKAVDNDKYTSLISKISKHLTENLTDLVTNMFNGADDALFRLAELAESNEEQTHYFDAMRMLRLERDNIGASFTLEVDNFLKPDGSSKTDGSDTEFDDKELALVDQDTMEEMVAISAMHSKAMNLFGQEISHLEARLDYLAIKTKRIFNEESFQPKNFCSAFQASLNPVELSIKNKLILYKLFDQEVISQMQPCYVAINNILIAENILPQIKLGSISAKPVGANSSVNNNFRNSETVESCNSSEPFSDAPYFPIDNDSSLIKIATNHESLINPVVHQQNEIHRAINNFLHGDIKSYKSHTGSSSTSSSGSTQYYDRRDVLKALSNLQHSYQPEIGENRKIDIEGFKQSLITRMGIKNGGAITKQVNQLDEKTIDLIEMLFEIIVEDNNVSEVVTNLLLRLQIPVIKVAMLDQEIFQNQNHPARNLMNLIVSTGKSITLKNDPLFPVLETEVDNLLKNFNVDIISFQKAIDNINAAINNDDSIIEKNERKTQTAILQEHARIIVLEEMQFRLKNMQFPSAVRPLILKHWSTLMFHRYIRNGRDSLLWKEACNVLILLINSIQPLNSSLSWQSLKHNHLGLIDTLKDYLNETKFSNEDIHTSLKNLKSTYNLLIENSKYNPDNAEEGSIAESEPDIFDITDEEITLESCACDSEFLESAISNSGEFSDENKTPSPVDNESEISRAKIANLPRDVRPGVWFEIFNGDKRSVRRLKLSVIIMEEAKLIFVDRLGKKVIEKDAAIFTEEIMNGQSKVIADHSAFDNALSKVITSLAASA